ncbi:protein eiger-like isoform X1 [Trichoplusia ni]|uniref:Protein eiger-like isoform X1 n=1 Tax=Trichoplusia ni TaxID=7111 RepID=A0A7E5WD81_TRINI|nr:protein eiger-like isoform X1 [Trichoplusia ni]
MAENHALIPEATAMYTQTNMKESQDISKNLMSGDFERQFRGAMVEKTDRRWQTWLITLAVVVGALLAWLLVFTVVRELQVRQLRREVDELTANMIAMSANFKSLSQKIDKNKLFNEFKDLQDTIYADEDISSLDGKEVVKDRVYDSLEKLHGLTVMEDDNIGDDEDMLDTGDDAESGDWYPDYDKREHIGTTNMVHLRPEDFVDSDLSFRSDSERSVLSNIREIRRRLNENPEDPDLPELQPLPTSTPRADPPTPPAEEMTRDKRSVFPPSTDIVDEFAAPRVVGKTDDRRKTKKFSPSSEYSTAKMALQSVTRTVRNSDYEEGARRPFIAAHFHGNTSHLSPDVHEHYKGNGLVRVSHGAAHDVWYPAPWTVASPHPRPTLTRNGHVHVHHTGVYLVYVQIYYLDSHDIISWVLHRTNADIEGRETLLQCAQSSHSTEHIDKPNSCFSAAAIFLRAGDRLAVRNTGGDRHSLMQPEKSFIGLVKLADAEDPTQEL